MKLTINEICNFTKSIPSHRNFIEGEKLLNAKHIIFCGKTTSVKETSDFNFIAFCLQTSNMKGSPHEINGSISSAAKIKDVKCSCKAGLSKKCKHSVAVFLYLSRFDVNDFDLVSCTDTKCLWKIPQLKSMETYTPKPLCEHECFKEKIKKDKAVTLTDYQKREISEVLITKNKNSALHKHMSGRHEPLIMEENNNTLEANCHMIQNIFNNSPSNSMLSLAKNSPCLPRRKCCANFLNSLNVNSKLVCEETFKSRALWIKERQFRVTGSRCYALYTYMRNKTPNWEKKSNQYFYPKPFKQTEAIKHGIEYETIARHTYEKYNGVKVEIMGLVVPEMNPWLGFSPDGVILDENQKCTKLIEVKCPFAGKTNTISDIVQFLPYLNTDLTLKKKHMYYAQIQIGMAILNIDITDFIVFASYDNSFLTVTIPFDQDFTDSMLVSLKNVYYNEMLHNVCIKEGLAE
ncbi:uncharacterized protein [Prorops nasuta]|uniref:uncharacterized protein n=1 Tax=Prorops nasuta TaxID=863751 RepID=UPI0034CE68CF